MPAASAKMIELRQLLEDVAGSRAGLKEHAYETGFAPLDEISLSRATLTEIVTTVADGPGGSLLIYGLLHAVLRKGERIVLIDGKTTFAPRDFSQSEINRLLWVRCHNAQQAMKAADLAVRDGNVPLVVLLLTLNPAGELRRTPASAWQRLQMVAEKSGVTVLAFTPQAQIGCARLRVSVSGSFPLGGLHAMREKLLVDLSVRVDRRRGIRGDEDGELRRALGG